jgi:hypothetical protein
VLLDLLLLRKVPVTSGALESSTALNPTRGTVGAKGCDVPAVGKPLDRRHVDGNDGYSARSSASSFVRVVCTA